MKTILILSLVLFGSLSFAAEMPASACGDVAKALIDQNKGDGSRVTELSDLNDRMKTIARRLSQIARNDQRLQMAENALERLRYQCQTGFTSPKDKKRLTSKQKHDACKRRGAAARGVQKAKVDLGRRNKDFRDLTRNRVVTMAAIRGFDVFRTQVTAEQEAEKGTFKRSSHFGSAPFELYYYGDELLGYRKHSKNGSIEVLLDEECKIESSALVVSEMERLSSEACAHGEEIKAVISDEGKLSDKLHEFGSYVRNLSAFNAEQFDRMCNQLEGVKPTAAVPVEAAPATVN